MPLRGQAAYERLEQLGLRYVAHAGGFETLADELHQIRRLSEPTLLHLTFDGLVSDEPLVDGRLGRRSGPLRGLGELPQREDETNRGNAVAAPLLRELLAFSAADSRVILVSLMDRYRDEFAELARTEPGRCFRVDGLERSSALVWCAALASGGCRPLVLVPKAFVRSHLPQIISACCEKRSPVTLIVCDPDADDASNEFGPEISSLAYARLLPETAVMCPADGRELRAMLHLSTAADGPNVLILPDTGSLDASPAGKGGTDDLQFGRGALLRSGCDVGLVAVGGLVEPARRSAEILAGRGIDCSVLNIRFLNPFDGDSIIRLARETRRIVTLEAGSPTGGLASAVLETLAAQEISTPVAPAGFHDTTLSRDELAWRIVRRVESLAPVTPTRKTGRAALAKGQRSVSTTPMLFRTSLEAEQRERDAVQATRLSPVVEEWVAAYEQVGHRSRFLWKWCVHGLKLTMLPCVPPELQDHVCDSKLLAVLFGVLLDDVADEQRDSRFLECLLRIPLQKQCPDFDEFTLEQQSYGDFTWRVWTEFQARIENYPVHAVFAELLQYDNEQILNTMRYSHLVNRNLSLLNLVEHDLYLPHNMQMMSFATLDLMCSPMFDCTELGRLREAIWHAQCMGRIGNLVSTWQREIVAGDYSSGIFARALMEGEVTHDDLSRHRRQRIETAIREGAHEDYFLQKWLHHRDRLRSAAPLIRSLDLNVVIDGLERLIHMELGSRGLK